MSTERGNIEITGFQADAVEKRDSLSDWSDEKKTELESRWVQIFRQIRRDRLALIGGTIVVGMLLMGIFARPIEVAGVPVQPISITPHDPAETLVSDTDYAYPSTDHLMGTDRLGRDVLSRVMLGARFSITIGIIVTLISVTFGVIYGGISGYSGGWVDSLMMRIVDMVFAFPGLVLAIVIVTVLGQSYWTLVAAFTATGWAGYGRLIRGEILKVKQNEYVLAAKALGGRDRRVLFRHVVPNAIAPVIVQSTLAIGGVVIGVAALGFLGLGFTGDAVEWGTMLNEHRNTVLSASSTWDRWWVTVYPGAMVFLFVMAMNMIGDAINDALDTQGDIDTAGAGGGG